MHRAPPIAFREEGVNDLDGWEFVRSRGRLSVVTHPLPSEASNVLLARFVILATARTYDCQILLCRAL